MSILTPQDSQKDWAFRFLWLSAMGSAFSLPVGRSFLLLCMITLCIQRFRYKRKIRLPVSARFWLLFAILAVFSSAIGINPSLSFSKINKLIWFMGIPAAATLAYSPARALSLLKAYVYGSGVLALDILVLRTLGAWRAGSEAAAAGGEMNLWWRIIDRGSMTHGQVLMTALIALAGLLTIAFRQRHPRNLPESTANISIPGGWALLGGITAALLINFKRGSWVAAGIAITLFMTMTGRRWRVAALLIMAVALGFLPPVQQRLAALENELSLDHGGRLVMWTKIAPELIREHPFGIGYRALDEALMQSTADGLGVRVEENRNHLHSNPLQILVSSGWAGLIAYLAWMTWGLFVGIRQTTGPGRSPESRLLGGTLTLMLSGLILNGLVEYNYGDAEIVLAYGLIFGMLDRRERDSAQ